MAILLYLPSIFLPVFCFCFVSLSIFFNNSLFVFCLSICVLSLYLCFVSLSVLCLSICVLSLYLCFVSLSACCLSSCLRSISVVALCLILFPITYIPLSVFSFLRETLTSIYSFLCVLLFLALKHFHRFSF